MKKIIGYILCFVFVLICLSGCGGKGKLSGAYESDAMGIFTQYKFNKDGTCSVAQDLGGLVTYQEGTYSVDGDKLNIIVDGIASQYTFSLDGNTLILYQGTGTASGIVFTKNDKPTDYSKMSSGEEAENITEAANVSAPTAKAADTQKNPKFLSGEYQSELTGITYMFNEEGKYSYNGLMGSSAMGTYSIDEDKITLVSGGVASTYKFSLDGDSLVLYEGNDSQGLVYTRIGDAKEIKMVSPVGLYYTMMYDSYTNDKGAMNFRDACIYLDENNDFTLCKYYNGFDGSVKGVEYEYAKWELDEENSAINLSDGTNAGSCAYQAGAETPVAITIDSHIFSYVPESDPSYGKLIGLVQNGADSAVSSSGAEEDNEEDYEEGSIDPLISHESEKINGSWSGHGLIADDIMTKFNSEIDVVHGAREDLDTEYGLYVIPENRGEGNFTRYVGAWVYDKTRNKWTGKMIDNNSGIYLDYVERLFPENAVNTSEREQFISVYTTYYQCKQMLNHADDWGITENEEQAANEFVEAAIMFITDCHNIVRGN